MLGYYSAITVGLFKYWIAIVLKTDNKPNIALYWSKEIFSSDVELKAEEVSKSKNFFPVVESYYDICLVNKSTVFDRSSTSPGKILACMPLCFKCRTGVFRHGIHSGHDLCRTLGKIIGFALAKFIPARFGGSGPRDFILIIFKNLLYILN